MLHTQSGGGPRTRPAHRRSHRCPQTMGWSGDAVHGGDGVVAAGGAGVRATPLSHTVAALGAADTAGLAPTAALAVGVAGAVADAGTSAICVAVHASAADAVGAAIPR